MPIVVLKENLFSFKKGIKYLSPWDSCFDPKYSPGEIRFYPRNSKNVVIVDINRHAGKLELEDIIIYLGNHNEEDIRDVIREKTDVIYEICQTITWKEMFILDLSNLAIVERDDFNSAIPIGGISSLFIFQNYESDSDLCYMIRNINENIADRDVFAWILSYIYSSASSLVPRDENITLGKQFLQVMAELYFTRGVVKSVHIITNKNVLNCPVGNLCRDDVASGLDVDRLSELGCKALEQMYPSTKKGIVQ